MKTNLKNNQHYNAEIVAGSLLLVETRKIARLLLDEPTEEEWNHAIVVENILQKRTPSTAKREANLIKNRLILMSHELWEIIYEGSTDLAIQSTLACSIKHSKLLGDFMNRVIREHWLTFDLNLQDKDWIEFWENCSQIDSGILKWSEKTYMKLKQVVFRILAESNYIENTKNLRLLSVYVLPEIKGYLINNNEDYVLECMQVTE